MDTAMHSTASIPSAGNYVTAPSRELGAAALPASPVARSIAEALKLVSDTLPVTRRLLHAGDRVYEAGERFESLHIVNSGIFKIVNVSADGREQVVALQFKGDWLGFDGISAGRHGCDAVAM